MIDKMINAVVEWIIRYFYGMAEAEGASCFAT